MSENLAAIRTQFNRQAEAYARMEVVTNPAILQLVVGLCGAGKEHRVLDVAAGPGFLTMAFAEIAGEVVGVDVTDAFLARARTEAKRRRLDNVTFVPADVAELCFAEATFDVAASKFAFHHFPRPARVLAEMKRVVRPGGKIVLLDMTTSEDPVKAAAHDEIEKLCDPTHARALPLSEWERMIREAGLTIAFQRAGETREPLSEWILHGGPPPGIEAEIRARMQAALGADTMGLDVREQAGEISFAHTGVTFLLER